MGGWMDGWMNPNGIVASALDPIRLNQDKMCKKLMRQQYSMAQSMYDRCR
jgi:hypothetical protein